MILALGRARLLEVDAFDWEPGYALTTDEDGVKDEDAMDVLYAELG